LPWKTRDEPQQALAALAGRNGLFTAVIVKAAARLAADPARFHVLYQKRTGAILAVGQALVEDVHHGEAGIEPDEVRKLQRPHGVIGAQLHRRIDRLNRSYPFVKGIDGL